MKKLKVLLFGLAVLSFSACNKKKVAALESELAMKNEQVEQLEAQLNHAQSTQASLLDRMADLSVVNKEGAESIRKSLDNITQQYSFIQDLTSKIQTKDSLNLALVMNLKRSLSNVDDEDIQVEVKGGFVYVSISDKLLFQSGSSRVNKAAYSVLGKIATVVNDHDDMNIMVEGHTDDVPISNSCVADNWDLSVKRATSVVRILQEDHYVAPERMTAAGRSQYVPKASNTTAAGRSLNRRTEIIIMPKLDQFFKLLEPPVVKN
ncbi:MAG: OmpA family protein [Phaeodactylibacter sp.]|nr:OmpA family protein [Phaeodactylibacter sp.]MCB9265861.1 OmpA family protein [Lewinellaceae bacterium]MCB9288801.1 OmpA family protein [Lewinellaceae bacterium]